MDFARSDIQTMLLDGAERLLGADAGIDYWREQRATPDGFDRARWAQFAELGWLALPLPEAAGGLGGSIEDVALLNVALGRALATEPYASSVVLAGHILASSSSEAAAPALEAIAGGASLVALAHAEHGGDALSLAALGTVAIRTGNGFTLSGAKLMALDGSSADRLIVSATIAGEDGTALFLVDPAAAGVSRDVYPLIDGTRAADIVLVDVSLPADTLLAGGNAGAALLGQAIDRAGIALIAQAVGSMEACLALCADYVKERRQFGQPIGAFQAVQHIMADMFVAAHQARSMLYHAIAACENGGETRSAALSAARLVVGEASRTVARNGIQLHGGYGLTDEYAISHHFRRLLVLEKLHGDIDRHTARFGDAVFA